MAPRPRARPRARALVGAARRARGARGRHHRASSTTTPRPNAIEGSLDVIADACAEVGVRVRVLLRGHRPQRARRRQGRPGRERAVPARRRATASSARTRASRSPTTPSTRCPTSPPISASGVHIHVAEDRGRRRRRAPGSLVHADQSWLLAHAVHLERARCRAPSCTTRGRTSTTRSGTAARRASSASRSAPTASAPTCSRSSGSRSRWRRAARPRLRARPTRGSGCRPGTSWCRARRATASRGATRRWSRGTSRTRPAVRPVRVVVDGEVRARRVGTHPGRRRRDPGPGA